MHKKNLKRKRKKEQRMEDIGSGTIISMNVIKINGRTQLKSLSILMIWFYRILKMEYCLKHLKVLKLRKLDKLLMMTIWKDWLTQKLLWEKMVKNGLKLRK
jgi:hypothetical protein